MNQSSLKETFLQSFDTYSDAIFRFCLMKTSSRELAEDLTQETFMKYWNVLQEGKNMTNTRSFLYTVANHMIIDWYRKKKPASYDVLEDQGFEAADTTTPSSLHDAELREIFMVIEDLDAKDKEVLLLRYAEGLDPKDISEILGESANVVSVRINRAIEKVKKKLSV